VGDGDGSKGIAIKSKNEDREAGVVTQLGEGEGVKRKVANVYRCKTMGKWSESSLGKRGGVNDGGRGSRKNLKRRWQMRLSWGRNTIENSSNVLGVTRGAKPEILGSRSK
jgi:hypothetical protein